MQVGAQSADPAACASNVRRSLGCAAPAGDGQRCGHHVQLAVYVRLFIPVREREHGADVHGRPLECRGPRIGALLQCVPLPFCWYSCLTAHCSESKRHSDGRHLWLCELAR